MQITK